MKANELMIGDWGNIYVFPNENPKGKDLFPAKITSIFTPTASESSGDTIECMFTTSDGTGGVGYASRPIETFLPIPLTAEILEKNGLNIKDLPTHFKEDENFDLEIWINDEGVVCWSINVAEYVVLQLKYVHELQHALKLCGIHKQIIL